MSRVLTGIQSTGAPHLGNLLGAILPGIELSRQPGNEAFFFIADFHSLTTVHDPQILSDNTYATAAAWLACGFDTDNGYFYRQSDIPEVTELTWYLTCFFPVSRLQLAHSFKDKVDSGKIAKVSSGLMFYPMLMAADILMYDAEIVPVGKDQQQHLEFTRVVANKINHQYGEGTLVVPEAMIKEDVKTVPGTKKDEEGKFMKMSKSYNNFINIFETDKKLRKTINKIQTDSTPQNEPKDPDNCLVYNLYKLIAPAEQVADLREAYLKPGMMYGDAKKKLFEAVIERFGDAREKYDQLMQNRSEIDARLMEGAEKAGIVAHEVLARVRSKLGYKKLAYFGGEN
ncbi:MAG: tryptophan--tRNA ligase [Bacteroidota bacterium]